MAVTNGTEFKTAYGSLDPTLLMIDLNLGGEDGIQLLRYLDQQKCTAPIILISGFDEKVLTTAMLLGESYGLKIVETLHKPVKVAMFNEILHKYQHTAPVINEASLGEAIANDEFILFYQPQISLGDNKPIGVEALVRWQPPQQAMIFPDQFIPQMEQGGLIKPLTEKVIRSALQQAADWKKQNIILEVSINISAKYLDDIDIPDRFGDLVKEYGLDPSQICWEITESAVADKPKLIMDILTRLRLKNFNLSMDDFGTGYSSLVALHRMPFSQIKIDKSFILRIEKDPALQILTHHLMNLFRDLHIETVAEGVETNLALKILEENACDIGQGYHFSKAISPPQLEEWLKKFTGK